MGIFDHRKQWEFEASADPKSCLGAFREALTGRSFTNTFRVAGRWDLSQGDAMTARALYTGRAGLLGGITPAVEMSRNERDAAKGSELTFKVVASDTSDERHACSMWLSRAGVIRVAFIPFTADARFIRGSMRRVAHRLRTIDPNVRLTLH
jgi:hypothetical protein